MFGVETLDWVRQSQHLFNDQIVAHLQAIQQTNALAAYAGLAMVGFLYGVFHAVGPGHGKVVVSTYVLANEDSLRRGWVIVGLSSLMQAVTAIVLVIGLTLVLTLTRVEAENAAARLEIFGFSLMAAIGIVLAAQGAHEIYRALKKRGSEAHTGGCDHNHMPSPKDLQANKSVAAMAAMIISVGIRPCTGALLLLFFSCLFGLVWPGIVAVFAMAAGTALTTGFLATLAATSKKLALSFVARSDRALRMVHGGLRVGGGLAIVVLAGVFLAAHMAETPAPEADRQHPLYKNMP